MRTRREVLVSAAGAAIPLSLGATLPAASQDVWPSKPIRIVIGFPPGGGIDTLIRVLLPVLSAKLGTPVFVENKPGAIGTIGNEAVARAAPDGYTLLATVVASYTTTVKMIKVQYDATKDLPPISIFASGGQAFITGANAKYRSLNDVFEHARSMPGTVNFGIIGKGTQDHLAGEFLRKEQDLKWEYIPFNSTALILQAMMRGEIQLSCMSFSVILPQIQGGAVRALAVAGKEASPFLPDVPPAGLPGYVSDYTYAIASPPGVPDAVIKRFYAALTETLKEPSIQTEMKNRSISALFTDPEESARTIQRETTNLAPLLASLDLRIE